MGFVLNVVFGILIAKAMTNCQTCAERRALLLKAWQDKQIADAVRLAAGGVKEMMKGNGDGNSHSNN